MDETTKVIHDYYNNIVEKEWERVAGKPEFLLGCRMQSRYIKRGDKVLDIGGGPGRYSLFYAEKDCDVTLIDLSSENVKFAKERAAERCVVLNGIVGDARETDKLVTDTFDHVLLMGPMYHLLEESDRVKAVNASLNVLKQGGMLFVSFINLFAGIIYAMRGMPELIDTSLPSEVEYKNCVINQKSFAGDAFTKAFFIEQSEVLPFMSQFPLEKLHLIGQEGITCPCVGNIMTQPPEIVEKWLDFCEQTWEREDLLSWSEHLMYVGRKM